MVIIRLVLILFSFSLFHSCSMFMEPVKDYFEKYTQDVRIVDVNFADDGLRDRNGTVCIPYNASDNGYFKITYTIINPRNYDLEYELRLSNDAQKILNSGLPGSDGNACRIEFSENYTRAEVLFSQDILRMLECGRFLNPELLLMDKKTGRAFPEKILKLKVNSAPPQITNAVTMLMEQPEGSGKFEYVVCFDLPSKSDVCRDGVHSDIEILSLIKRNGEELTYSIADGSMKIDDSGAFSFDDTNNFAGPRIVTHIENDLIPTEMNGNEIFSSQNGQAAYILTGVKKGDPDFEMTVILKDYDGLTSKQIMGSSVEKLKQDVVYIDSKDEMPDFIDGELLKDGTLAHPFNSLKGGLARISELNDGETEFCLVIVNDMVLKASDLDSKNNTFGFYESEKNLKLNIKTQDGLVRKISADNKGRHLYFAAKKNAGIKINIENVEFLDGFLSDGNGGCLLVTSDQVAGDCTLSLCNTKISNCFAQNGGAVHAENFNLVIRDGCMIDSCAGKFYGGAIFLRNAEAVLNGEIKNNRTTGDTGTGGGIWLSDCSLRLGDNALIEGNDTVKKLGSAIDVSKNGKIIFSGNCCVSNDNDILVSDLSECRILIEGKLGESFKARISLDSCQKSIYETFLISHKPVVDSVGEYVLCKNDIEKLSMTDILNHTKVSRNYILDLKDGKGILCSKTEASIQVGLHPEYCFEFTSSIMSRKSPADVSFVFKVKDSDGNYVDCDSKKKKISLYQGGSKVLSYDDNTIPASNLAVLMAGAYQIEGVVEFENFECIATSQFMITE